MSKTDFIYKKINDAVIEGLKKDGLNWFKPFGEGEQMFPINYVSKRKYNGFNIFMLNAVMREKGYEYNQWLTFKAVTDNGGKVKKGEKSTEVYLWNMSWFDEKTKKFIKDSKEVNIDEKFEGKLRYKKIFSIKYYRVFNVAQCEGIVPIGADEPKVEKTKNNPIEIAESVVKRYLENEPKFKIVHAESNRAFYNVMRDFVNVPKIEGFTDSDSYYKVLFHELAHSTGHEDRLNRKSLTEVMNWGDETYAKEELVAEISSMYMVGLLGLEPHMTNSQAYIQGWCKHLEDKPKECVFAMQQATKVVDYIQR
jgi:antirestriction protein ArdC